MNELSILDRVEMAARLLKGTGFEVTETVKTSEFDKLLDSKELAAVQALPTIADKLKAKTPTQHAQQLADFLNAEHGDKYHFAVEPGARKYARVSQVWRNEDGTPKTTGKSVHCFVDGEGNVYKAAGWKTPAKGVRGTVFEFVSGRELTDPYGGYLYATAS